MLKPRRYGTLMAMLRSPSLSSKQQVAFEKYVVRKCHDEMAVAPNQLLGSEKGRKETITVESGSRPLEEGPCDS